jgi:hypothetical protein
MPDTACGLRLICRRLINSVEQAECHYEECLGSGLLHDKRLPEFTKCHQVGIGLRAQWTTRLQVESFDRAFTFGGPVRAQSRNAQLCEACTASPLRMYGIITSWRLVTPSRCTEYLHPLGTRTSHRDQLGIFEVERMQRQPYMQ